MKVAKFLISAVLFGCIAPAVTQEKESAEPSFTLSISAPHYVVSAGAPILIQGTLTNTSNHDIYNVAGVPGRPLKIEVRDINDKLVPKTAYGRREEDSEGVRFRGGSVATTVIKPGETVRGALDIGPEYDLPPGDYTVQALRKDGALLVKSNTILLTVTR